MNDTERHGFRDPTRLTNRTRTFLCASIVVMLFSAGTRTAVLLGYGLESPSPLLLLFVIPWAIVMAGAAVASAVLVLVWIHRANHNARALGATGLKMTPGWAVGWYFVPIAWFWKPYQAMKEIWQASIDPKHWWRQGGSPLLVWWWGLWLAGWWVPVLFAGGPVRIQFARGAGVAVQAETMEAVGDIAVDILHVPLTLILLMIIDRIHNRQMEHFSSRTAA
ncbi:MAG: DUF4328 domain-containing protein [Gemmatimonadota bacterium]|nr:DUF4328 domain-containing protein [Gemmatimonadota bacterium]MDE2871137.1 DUF4328 domain-containing protein [Gemmatimonadota bacterium]